MLDHREAKALVLGALGTLSHLSGVKAANVEWNGQTAAIAIMEGARFGEDAYGTTTLE